MRSPGVMPSGTGHLPFFDTVLELTFDTDVTPYDGQFLDG